MTAVRAAAESLLASAAASSTVLCALGARVTSEDRASGTITGKVENGTVTASVRQQADGSVRVQFDANGLRDPGLLNRVSNSYDRRMGR